MALGGNDFNAIRISLASPEQMKTWSYGEVTKPETINYRTLRPEKDGLFCERIFGPTKDWECYCGKYKKIRFKGVICDRCGVEVARAKVRRERMGHITLAAPVAHIWFSKGTPSRLGLLLDLSPRNLDRVLYFAQYLVTQVDGDYVQQLIDETNDKLDAGLDRIDAEGARRIAELRDEMERVMEPLGERRAAFMEWRAARDPEAYALGERAEEDRRREISRALNAEREKNAALRDELASLRARRAAALRDMPSHYAALGVITGASPAEIDCAYRQKTVAESDIADVDRAYEVLKNAETRGKYAAETARKRAAAVQPLDDQIAEAEAAISASDSAVAALERDLAEAVEMVKFVEIDEALMVIEGNISQTEIQIEDEKAELETSLDDSVSELESLSVGDLLTESRYRELRDNYPGAFKAGMGAESVLEVLKGTDLDKLRDDLQEEMQGTSGQRRKRAIKRLRVVEAFRKSGNMAEWMIMTALPVLPPELRPMVQLDGGRFATSDLNDLYRRVINRNNRLKRLMDLGAPEIIVRNEKRMLQEAVDALVDNGRRGRAVAGSHNHRLKSLSDLLRGKQGRFRQNLLGKRVDYSGRSVIVAGPELKLHQCGLPRRMALELFKPFVMNRLVMKGYAHNIKSAKRMAERISPEVWDILEEVVGVRPVLLNRAPTLHRLGIQAFEPVLIDGGAIQLHPLVCTAFNADFDGDQMAVHVPLSSEAVTEARQLMLSSLNMLAPSSGEPIVAPTLDIALGAYYMTRVDEKARRGVGRKFRNFDDARLAHELGSIDLCAGIEVKVDRRLNVEGEPPAGDWLKTTVGRVIFNDTLPEEMPFYNDEIEKGALKDISERVYDVLDQDNQGTAEVLDNIKTLGFKYATKSGTTIAINDIEVPQERDIIVEDAENKVRELEDQFEIGLSTGKELYDDTILTWSEANDHLTGVIAKNLENYGGIQLMASSGAKGNIAQIKQMAGMRGLMAGPRGLIRTRPIKKSFRDGLSVLEYFLSTHGARKGLTDTALNTANSGYLTRRLIDVAQEIIILSEDCETPDGVMIRKSDIEANTPDELKKHFAYDLKTRYLALPVADPNTGEVLFDRNEVLGEDDAKLLAAELRCPRYQNQIKTAKPEDERERNVTRTVETVAENRIVIRTVETLREERAETVDEFDLRLPSYMRGEREINVAMRPVVQEGDAVEERDHLLAEVVNEVNVRSPMTCEAPRGICQKCYGLSLATLRDSMIGEAVGIMAAQSIGEPGTQLTMRTFHTGGDAFEQDITTGLPRVEELFEARVPKMEAVLSEIDGVAELEDAGEQLFIRISNEEEFTDEYILPPGFSPIVEDGATVAFGQALANLDDGIEMDEEALAIAGDEVVAGVSGTAAVNGNRIAITWSDTDLREYIIPNFARRVAQTGVVRTGDRVSAGQALSYGVKNPQEILRIQGREYAQRYLINEVQKVYRAQGVPIHNKHLELIISQMLRKVQIDDPGDTELMPGEYMDRQKFNETNENILAEGGEPSTATPVLLGITRASLNMDSFLAAASFQETTRVLTESAVNGQIDQLRGLKENVIIGRLIPARLNPNEDGGVSGLSLEEANRNARGMGAMSTSLEDRYIQPTIVPPQPDPAFEDPDFVNEIVGEIVEPDAVEAFADDDDDD